MRIVVEDMSVVECKGVDCQAYLRRPGICAKDNALAEGCLVLKSDFGLAGLVPHGVVIFRRLTAPLNFS